ncbi:hypothetical protein N3K66_002114 [Trichothecium roseum]|uniref:Uncharacterized protein n=1 Tax=Trichothecium roseum TaxID=47278 RepID=A0ACC0V8N0_9HYPO|nr:hypothetical protein N3K66_002114 [Trichothecium roseum]
MNYHSIHGHDVASFETTDYHRMPTVSASAALNRLKTAPNISISTGLQHLDSAIQYNNAEGTQDQSNLGGVKRGQVTEIWGPPGTGVTTMGVQIAANATRDGGGVVWVDCFQTVCSQQLNAFTKAIRTGENKSAQEDTVEGRATNIIHYNCLTLPHLLALILRPTTKIVPSTTSLLVLDSVSALINSSLPKSQDVNSNMKQRNGPTPSVKRRQALQAIMKALQTIASSRNCAVVLLSQCATKMQSERGATLTPAINATVWEQGVSTRIVLFRDWIWRDRKYASVYLAGVQKLDDKSTTNAVESISAFKVEEVSSSLTHGCRRHVKQPLTTSPSPASAVYPMIALPMDPPQCHTRRESLVKRPLKFQIVKMRTMGGRMRMKRQCQLHLHSGRAVKM